MKKKAQFKSPRSRLVNDLLNMRKELDAVESGRRLPRHRLQASQPDPEPSYSWVNIPDPVNHPPHYTKGGIETIDFIEAKDLNYRLGNVVKYVSRAGKKDSDPLEDLRKARWYLDREISVREKA